MSFIDSILGKIEKDHLESQESEAKRRGISLEEVQKEERERERLQEQQEREEARRIQVEEEKANAIEKERRAEYGRSINLNVPAFNATILNIGGLTERSDGSGSIKSTVWHVVVDGELQKGRLYREPGDLLCKPARTLGRRSMGVDGTGSLKFEYGGLLYFSWSEDQVTCRACLKKLQALEKAR